MMKRGRGSNFGRSSRSGLKYLMEEWVILPYFVLFGNEYGSAPAIVLKANMVVVLNIGGLGLLKAYDTMVV